MANNSHDFSSEKGGSIYQINMEFLIKFALVVLIGTLFLMLVDLLTDDEDF